MIDCLWKKKLHNRQFIEKKTSKLELSNISAVLLKNLVVSWKKKYQQFKLLKVVIDVLFKLLIENIEFVDNEFKKLRNVVDVLFTL